MPLIDSCLLQPIYDAPNGLLLHYRAKLTVHGVRTVCLTIMRATKSRMRFKALNGFKNNLKYMYPRLEVNAK